MQNVPLILKEILDEIPKYSNINLLTLSDGVIEDQNETKNNAEELYKELNGSYNNINSKAIRFMSDPEANPDTLALCSLLRFNSLQNSNKNDLTTFLPKDYNLGIPVEIESGILQEKCEKILKDFFVEIRKKK